MASHQKNCTNLVSTPMWSQVGGKKWLVTDILIGNQCVNLTEGNEMDQLSYLAPLVSTVQETILL